MEQPFLLLPEKLFAPAESSCFSGTYQLPFLKAGSDLYEFSAPLDWSVVVSNTGDALLMTGTVEGVARISCARCLAPFEFPLTGEIEGYFLLSEDAAAPEEKDEDEFTYVPKDRVIDMTSFCNAALLLALPLIPHCDEACKGLCPTCGQNLNEGSCDCSSGDEETENDNPFAALKDYPFPSSR